MSEQKKEDLTKSTKRPVSKPGPPSKKKGRMMHDSTSRPAVPPNPPKQ